MMRSKLVGVIIIYYFNISFSMNKLGTYHCPMRQVNA